MKSIYKIFLFALIIGLMPSSCSNDDLVALNVNPNAADEIDWKFVFSNGLIQVCENRYTNWRANLIYSAHLIQHMGATAGYIAGDKYTRNGSYASSHFDNIYRNALKSLAEVLAQTGPEGSNPDWTNLHDAAEVAYIFGIHRNTDLHGNVPYSEANQGIEGIFFPNYDSQESIYRTMLSKLEAVSFSGSDDISSADFMFNGDLGKWKKLANSLMLRLAMRVSNVDPGLAQEYVGKAIAGGLISSNDEIAFVPMAVGPNQWLNQNGISRALKPGDGGDPAKLSKTMIDHLQNTGDPRLMVYSGGIGAWGDERNMNPDEQFGLPNGYDSETIKEFIGTEETVDVEATFSRLNPLLLSDDEPYFWITYGEVELLLAEAALKGWTTDAQTHYEAGVKAAMQMWTLCDASLEVSDGQVADYLAANPFSEADGERLIGEQIWLATMLNWYESWANWRRTGYPELTPVNYPGNVSGGQIFRRLEYPTTEAAINPKYDASATLPNDFMTRVWWDVN